MDKIGHVRSRIVLLMAIASLAGCAAGIEAGHGRAPLTVRAGETFVVTLGNSVALRDTNYVIMFDAVPEDSRCQREVACVWEGNARVLLTVREAVPGKEPGTLYEVVDETVELNTSTRFEQRRKLPVGVLELRGLEPQAPVGHPEQYAATLFVEASQ